jgi:hypothetical protein
MKKSVKTLKVFRPFSDANHGSQLLFEALKKCDVKTIPFIPANIIDSSCVTKCWWLSCLPFINVFDPQSGTAISILKYSDILCAYISNFSERF